MALEPGIHNGIRHWLIQTCTTFQRHLIWHPKCHNMTPQMAPTVSLQMACKPFDILFHWNNVIALQNGRHFEHHDSKWHPWLTGSQYDILFHFFMEENYYICKMDDILNIKLHSIEMIVLITFVFKERNQNKFYLQLNKISCVVIDYGDSPEWVHLNKLYRFATRCLFH